MEYKRHSMGSNCDDPPLSRLFIVGPKSLTEDAYRKHFQQFGTIEEIWMVTDKSTGEYKGKPSLLPEKNLHLTCFP